MSDENNTGSSTGENGDEVKFSAEQQKKVDELITQRLGDLKAKHSKELEGLKAQHKLDLEEADKKAKMTAEQLKQQEDEKVKKELETLKAEKKEREHKDAISKLFTESGINAKISQNLFFNFADLEVAKAEMSNFKKVFEDVVLEEVNKRLSSHTPKTGGSESGSTKNPFLNNNTLNLRKKV